jgi:hypothetical protein
MKRRAARIVTADMLVNAAVAAWNSSRRGRGHPFSRQDMTPATHRLYRDTARLLTEALRREEGKP